MQVITWKMLNSAAKREALQRPFTEASSEIGERVSTIISEVREEGDRAAKRWRAELESPESESLRVDRARLEQLASQADPALVEAMKAAKANIEAFHRPQIPAPYSLETAPGVTCEMRYTPLDSAGLYVPGGSAPLVSSLLMQVIPAQLAGVERIAVATPSPLSPAIAAAAKLCGIKELYEIGGAQAIAALAFGSDSIESVAKITGPGNPYVTEAKRQVSQSPNGPAIEMPAGPSEVMVIADNDANPRFVAADLLSQAEHGPDSQAILVCLSHPFASAVMREIQKLTAGLSRKASIESAMSASRAFIVDELLEALAIANAYAPEHLILQTEDNEAILPHIYAAGSIFVGAFTPESAGDYASGTNHVLPTAGAARAYSGLKVTDFMRSMSIQRITKEGLTGLAPTIQTLADAEGLDAHRLAVDIRLEAEDA